MWPQLEAYGACFASMMELRHKIRSLQMDEAEKARKVDSLHFQIDELERANLKTGEEEELNARRDILRNSEKYISALSGADYCLSGDDDSVGALAQIREAEMAWPV